MHDRPLVRLLLLGGAVLTLDAASRIVAQVVELNKD